MAASLLSLSADTLAKDPTPLDPAIVCLDLRVLVSINQTVLRKKLKLHLIETIKNRQLEEMGKIFTEYKDLFIDHEIFEMIHNIAINHDHVIFRIFQRHYPEITQS